MSKEEWGAEWERREVDIIKDDEGVKALKKVYIGKSARFDGNTYREVS